MSKFRRQNAKRKAKASPSMPVINPHAAGIDIGSDSMYVSVPIDSCPTPVAVFGVFTDDLLELVNWLKECGVLTVAMESTGVYWIPLFEILEEHGFDVILVAPNYPKKPEKSDFEDCQWLQYLHSVGLLRGSFRPPEAIRAVREILRQRATHVQQGAAAILRMQKSMTQMNLLLHNVLTDISGITGLRIIDAILAGERDPNVLAQHRDRRCKASAETVAKSLTGHYRDEHLFSLRQQREALRFYQQQITECDAEIERVLQRLDGDPPTQLPERSASKKSSHTKNEVALPNGDLRAEAARILGVDLSAIPGIGPNVLAVILTEVGPDLKAFANADAFVSWLKLCPKHLVSGGRKLRRAYARSEPRLATAFRQAAQSLHDSDCYLGHFLRRMMVRFSSAIGIKATAHKLARIVYALLTTKTPYDESRFAQAEERSKQRKLNRLVRDASQFGLALTPLS